MNNVEFVWVHSFGAFCLLLDLRFSLNLVFFLASDLVLMGSLWMVYHHGCDGCVQVFDGYGYG